ncbi:(R)-mandelonitrile lyase-like protein [Tanacetum coccineum]
MLLQQSLIQVVRITDSGASLEASSNVLPYPSSVHTVFMRPLYYSIVSIMEKIIGPLSTGSILLASPKIITNPVVRFIYFINPVDLQRCVNGTRRISELLRTRAVADYKFGFGDGLGHSEHYMELSWGCLMERVVDSELRVLGVGSLRVIDGSVFPTSPGTNPHATLLMLGGYMGLKILIERMQKTSYS